MKKVLLVLISAMVLMFAAGCGNNVKTQAENTSAQNDFRQARAGLQNQTANPEAKLSMNISMLGRIQRSENPLIQEQKDKIIPILKEISAKTAVDEKYAEQKTQEIDGILTDVQKNTSFRGPNGKENQGRRGAPSDVSGEQQKQRPPTNENMGRQRQGSQDNFNPNGENRRMGGQNFDGGKNNLKIICERIIGQLEGNQIERPQPPVQKQPSPAVQSKQ